MARLKANLFRLDERLTDELRGSIPLQATMKEIIYNGDKAYQLVRVLREDQLKDPDTSLLKKWFMCDTLLRNQGKLYFCRLIEDIEYEEIEISQ